MNRRIPSLLVLGVLVAATVPAVCSAAQASPSGHGRPVVTSTGLLAGEVPLRGRASRTTASPDNATPAAVPNLTYRGGRVLTNPVVDSVLWGSGTYQGAVDGTDGPAGLGSFFSDVLHSAYLAWLDEYRVPGGTGIGGRSVEYGDFAGSTRLSGTAPATISDATIQSTLLTDVGNGTLPAPVPDGNGHSDSVYALFFPAGTQVTDPYGARSMVDFCAYHGTTGGVVNGMHLTYMILPDPAVLNGNGGCGPGSDTQVVEDYTSHELAEVVTDPDVGIATGTGAGVLGWYDDNLGEISDICDTGSGADESLDGFQVQENWSRTANACVATRPTAAAGVPTGVSARFTATGHATLRWTAPTGTLAEYDVQQTGPHTPAGRFGTTVAHVAAGATSWTTPTTVPAGTRFHLEARSLAGLVASPAVGATVTKVSSRTGGSAAVLTRHRIRLTIQVRASLPVTGRLRVRLGTTTLRTLTLTAAMKGRAVVTVTVRPGRRTLTATYAGSATVSASRHSWTKTVPR